MTLPPPPDLSMALLVAGLPSTALVLAHHPGLAVAVVASVLASAILQQHLHQQADDRRRRQAFDFAQTAVSMGELNPAQVIAAIEGPAQAQGGEGSNGGGWSSVPDAPRPESSQRIHLPPGR
jgi:hypothetical protein